MAKSITLHVEDMTDAAIPNGTAMYFQIRDPSGDIEASDSWIAFDADNAAWRTANPGQPDPSRVPFTAVAVAETPTLGERLFAQSRFQVTSSESSQLRSSPATWMQVNSTNFSTADIAAGKAFLKSIYDAQRIYEDLVPA